MFSRFLLAVLIGALVLAVLSGLLFQSITVAALIFIAFVAGALITRLLPVHRAPVIANTIEHDPVEPVVDSSHSFSGAVSASALLEATMNGMREGVLVVDRKMQIIAANRAAREIFSPVVGGALTTRRLSDLTRNPPIHTAFLAALEQGELREVKVETHEGQRRIFDLRVAPLGGQTADAPQGAIGVFFDITRLERLERVRQEFLSNVSHELRTPLTAILTFIETLEAGAVDDAEHNRRFLEIIRRNAARMHNLIDDILELSAIEAGTVTVAPARIRLHSLVSDVLTAVAARARSRNIELHNETTPDAFVLADARRLEQMLTNLVDNAIKFNRDGGAVTVKHERRAARDHVIVADTGEGIAPEHIERIFERFYRVDQARSRALGGTGLGLAIVKHLARAHGGETTVTSMLGHGAIFTLELPVAPQQEEAKNDESDDLLPLENPSGETESAYARSVAVSN